MNTRIDDLIVLAALGELTDLEAQELDRAVLADPVVAADLADALSGAATLQLTGAEAPPAGLKLSVMDAIAGLAQDPPGAVASAGDGEQDDATAWDTDMTAEEIAAAVLAKDREPKGPESVPMPRSAPEEPSAGPSGSVRGSTGAPHERTAEVRSIDSARSRRRFTPWVAAAAAAVVIAVGAVVVLSNDGDGGGRSAEIAAVLDADDAQPHSVAGEIGELEFVYSPSQGAFVLVADGLELPPDDATYQVWLVRDGAQSSLGTFEPDDDGHMEMRADGIDPSGATIGITREPVGGSDVPTEPMVAESVV